MDPERALKLLNNIINQLSSNEEDNVIVKYLLYVGFTKKELTEIFKYPEALVDECDNELSNEDWELGPVFMRP